MFLILCFGVYILQYIYLKTAFNLDSIWVEVIFNLWFYLLFPGYL